MRAGLYWLTYKKEFIAKFTFGPGADEKGKILAAKCSQAPPSFPFHSVNRRGRSGVNASFVPVGKEPVARFEKGAVPVSPACSQKAISSLTSVPMPGRT